MNIDFYKVHVLKNDFVVSDFRKYSGSLKIMSKIAAAMCCRNTGIGANGVIFISDSRGNEITVHTFSKDGKEYENRCDSSICASRFIFDHISFNCKAISIVNNSKSIPVQILDSMNFRISAGTPLCDENSIESIILDNRTYSYTSVEIGVKGIVFFPGSRGKKELKELTSKLVKSETFFNAVPLFAFPSSRNRVAAKTWYLSRQPDHCLYSAAVSAAAALNGYENDIIVTLDSLPSFCEWDRKENIIYVTASPEYAFYGSYFFDETGLDP